MHEQFELDTVDPHGSTVFAFYAQLMRATADMLDAVSAAAPGSTVLDVVPLFGGSSASVVKLLLSSPTGGHRSIVFRQHSDRTAKGHNDRVAVKEHRVLTALAGIGLEVPRALAVCGDTPADGSWLAMEFVDGSDHVSTDALDGALSAMADFLARLHSCDVSVVDDAGLEPIEDPVLALPPYLPDDPTGHALQLRLAEGVARNANASVVLHGDYWPGNVLFSAEGDGPNRLVAVIDWEDATLGDPLVDLACARVELTCAYGAESARVFTERYLAARHVLDLTDLPLWEVYVSATALSSMHRWGLTPADEAQRRATTRSFFETASTAIFGQ